MFVDNYGSVASGARYGYNLLEADNLSCVARAGYYLFFNKNQA